MKIRKIVGMCATMAAVAMAGSVTLAQAERGKAYAAGDQAAGAEQSALATPVSWDCIENTTDKPLWVTVSVPRVQIVYSNFLAPKG